MPARTSRVVVSVASAFDVSGVTREGKQPVLADQCRGNDVLDRAPVHEDVQRSAELVATRAGPCHRERVVSSVLPEPELLGVGRSPEVM